MRARSVLVILTLFTIGVAPCGVDLPAYARAVAPRASAWHAAIAQSGGGKPAPTGYETVSGGKLISPADDALLDLYGNEISEAVARYKLDPTGTLYEEHSPETELPRLGPPKS